jgi:ABC-type sugar transport system ATPase subunit
VCKAGAGVDVGAKEQIYTLIDELAGEGRSIIVVSSELAEQFNGKPRKLVLQATRNGHFFVLDRVTGDHLLTSRFTPNGANG